MHSDLSSLLMLTTLTSVPIDWNANNSAWWCAFSGNDLANVLTKSEDCASKCASTAECTHFTWTDYNSGTCWMKRNKVSKRDALFKDDQNAVCGIIGSDDQSVNWNGDDTASYCAFSGNDLTNVQSKSEHCSSQCESTPNCTHFTWTDYNSGTCWMKTNNVSKREAFSKHDQNAFCGVVNNVSGRRSITFLNRCAYPIWMSPFPTLGNGIQRIESNAQTTYDIPDSGWKGRFWPKTECDGNGQNCAVGQSIPPCPSNGCQPPAETKVEFFFPTSSDQNAVWYDISLVDGYSLPMEIIPNKQERSCITTNCAMKLDACPSNENSVGDLRVTRNGRVVQCLAPCKKWNYPPPYGMGKPEQIDPGLHFCCPTPPINPKQCTAGIVTQTQYVKLIHRDCPTAYSYAYDDEAGLHNCPNPTSFQINIC